MKIPDKVIKIMNLLKDGGASDVLIVGGFVRDSILGIANKDIDIEVFGLSLDKIQWILQSSNKYKINIVGKSFGVLKVDNEIDISVPRRENKVGSGHRGFDIECDPDMSIKEAASRRDFTINSMAMRVDGEILDPFDGRYDLEGRNLRATSSRFIEDPLRAMRAMQFSARFSMFIDEETVWMCQDMAAQKAELPKERLWEEWKKWALKGGCPGLGIMNLIRMNWADPEIIALVGVPQNPAWHPEGTVEIHTGHVVNAAAKIADDRQLEDHDRLVLMFAALCHDFGKPSTTVMKGGVWRSPGHCQAGIDPARSFLERIGAPVAVIAEVLPLILDHLVHAGINIPSDRAVRRLAKRLHPSSINMLSMLINADHNGRPPLPLGNPLSHWLPIANNLDVSNHQPDPIIRGRDLISLGIKPGKFMGTMIVAALEAQIDGEFTNLKEGLRWIESRLDNYDT